MVKLQQLAERSQVSPVNKGGVKHILTGYMTKITP